MKKNNIITVKLSNAQEGIMEKMKKAELLEMAQAAGVTAYKSWTNSAIAQAIIDYKEDHNTSTEEKEATMATTEKKEEALFVCAHCGYMDGERDHTKEMVKKCSARKAKGLASRRFANLLLAMSEERGYTVTDELRVKAFNLSVEEATAAFDSLKASVRQGGSVIVHNDDAEVTCGACTKWEDGKAIEVKKSIAHVREHYAKVYAK